ncbi:MAG: orotate phosphoribosyltransferase [Clostridiales bacterium]|jgi:orotate phosphoribosyltransferase|nr:orotate phosphoribosyltransferase [Clostridiales bacterium]
MNATQETIERLLFETGAIRVAPEDRPFWSTSGTLGPYYCNTHFRFGGEPAAAELLALIDDESQKDAGRQPPGCVLPAKIAERVLGAAEDDARFRAVADCISAYLESHVDMARVDFISGGERRDWFFSFVAASRFSLPHLTIYKDGRMVLGGAPPRGAGDTAVPVADGSLAGLRCLHVSDLITEASSYVRAWAPAAARAGARITTSLTIIDRLQGGGAALAKLGIEHLAIASIDAGLFDRALAAGYVNERQHALVLGYLSDPNAAMRAFLAEHPGFLRSALDSGGKDAERARLCIESRVYGSVTKI